jgi:hypothetical protein
MPDAAATSIPWWLPLIPGLIGGGAAGALIKAWLDYKKDRLQPINYQIDTLTLFDGVTTILYYQSVSDFDYQWN